MLALAFGKVDVTPFPLTARPGRGYIGGLTT
jgi:hypothetical protein